MINTNIQIIRRLDKFASAFSRIKTLDELVLAVENILEDIFHVEYTGLYLFDPEEGQLKLLYAKGFSEEEKLNAGSTARGRHPWLVYSKGEMIYIPDTMLNNKNITISSERSFVVRSRLYLPVKDGDEVVGAFGIVDTKPSAYSEKDIAVLSFICNMAGALYGNILNQSRLKSANEQIINLSKFPSESPNPVMRFSNDKILLFANENSASKEILKYYRLKVGEPLKGDLEEGLTESLKTGNRVTLEISIENKIYSIMFIPVENAGYINLHGKDITEQKKLEEEQRKLALIVRVTEQSVVITNKAGEIEWVNEAFLKLTGYTIEEVKGLIPGKFLQGEETDPKSVMALSKAIRNNEPIEVDIINYTKSRKKYWVKIQLQPVYNSSGQVENYISIQKEITREKEIQQELIRKTTFQKAILNSAAIAIISTDMNGIIQSFNPAASKMLGYTAEEVIGIMTPHQYHDEMDIQNRFRENLQPDSGEARIFNTKDIPDPAGFITETGEFTFVRKDGDKFPVSLSVTALRGEQNEITGFLAMAEEITQRKQQYDALRVANLRFRSLLSSMQASVLVEDEDRKVVLVNQYFCDLFSIPATPEQLIGSDCGESAEAVKGFFKDPETFILDIDKTLAVGQIISNHELQMNNGTFFERDFIPIEDLGKKNRGILWIYRDITERKKNESDLLRQSKILNGSALASNYLLTLHDYSQAIQKALETIGKATGADRAYIFTNQEDEFSGESFFSEQFEWTAEGITPQIDNPKLQNIPVSSEFPRWYKLLKENKLNSGFVKDFPENERKMLESQGIISMIAVPVFIQDRLWGLVGFDNCTNGIEWSATEASILTAFAGSIGGSVLRSIIEKELISARQTAEYATKSKSEFLATMSHEIRTPMNGVIGMTSLLLKTPLATDQREYAETIRLSGELLLNVINDILDFSKIESGKMILEETSFDLRKSIEDVLDLMSTVVYEKKLGLHFQVDPTIPQLINGDPTRLRQILVNLTGNAIKFTNSGGIVIALNQIEKRGREAVLEFSIKDTGVGIPKEKLNLLFKPFSQVDASTTRKYGGTGLGLAICMNLVKLMHGKIWVKSEVNKGSEFHFTIKTLYPEIAEQVNNPDQKFEILKRKKILVVENNAVSETILTGLFKDLEMDTSSVNSAGKALEIIGAKSDFDIIFIDIDLPDLESGELASEIRKTAAYAARPIILSGWSAVSANESTSGNNFNAQINKPLKHSQLIAIMADLLANQKTEKVQLPEQPQRLKEISGMYPLNILVAEDNLINQKLILNLLKMLGYTIQIAANGSEALDAISRIKFDIIFMDMQMPVMDGLEATRQIIVRYADQRPLIVAMTANALGSDKELCLSAGMDDYISKPLNIDQVINGIEKWSSLIIQKGKTADNQLNNEK